MTSFSVWSLVTVARSGGVLVADHVQPCAHFLATATRDEVNAPENPFAACDACNRAKGPQDLDGFAAMLRGRGLPAADLDAMVQRARTAVARSLPPPVP